jgi:hypothetical protein
MLLTGDWWKGRTPTKGWATTDYEGTCGICGKHLYRFEVWINYDTFPRGGERCREHVPQKED